MLPLATPPTPGGLPAALVTQAVGLARDADVPALRVLVNAVRPFDLTAAVRLRLAEQPGGSGSGSYTTHPRLVLVDCCAHLGPDPWGYCGGCLVPWSEVINGAVYATDPLPYLAVLAGAGDRRCLRAALVDLAAALPDGGQRLIATLRELLERRPWEGVHDADPAGVLADCCPHPGRTRGGYCTACRLDLASLVIEAIARA